jgi:hypothetical protein
VKRYAGWVDALICFGMGLAVNIGSGMRGVFMTEGSNAARRTEDIALDLLKFVAAQAHVGTKATGGTGFGVAASAKPEDQVTELLALYTRCRQAVEAPVTK